MAGDSLGRLLAAIDEPPRLLIVTHDNPDPDALVTATALGRLVQAASRTKCRICCAGVVGRAENRVLARALRIKPMAASRLNWHKWPRIALVDCQPGTGNNSFPPRRLPDVVIDHHPLRSRTRGRFIDVKPSYGACATILAEYMQQAEVAPGADLAAAFCYAIASETRDFSRDTCPEDIDAYVRLYPVANKRLLSRILHPRLKHSYYSMMARAVISAFTYSNIIGSHLGDIDHPDTVSLVADFLIQHQRMGWSFVTGRYRNGLVVSVRTLGSKAHAGQLLRRVLSKRGRAGGHGTMAGGQVPLNELEATARDQLQNDLALRFIQVLRRRKDVELKPLIDPGELEAVCKRP